MNKTRFKELRREKELTQYELSNILNLEQTTVSKWELGKAFPDTKTLIKLAEFYDVSIDYLLGLSELYYPDRISHSFEITEIEKQHISYLRQLPTETQSYIFGLVENLAVSG